MKEEELPLSDIDDEVLDQVWSRPEVQAAWEKQREQAMRPWEREVAYDPDQERDDHGRWSKGGGGATVSEGSAPTRFSRDSHPDEVPTEARTFQALDQAEPLFQSPSVHPVVTGGHFAILTGDYPRDTPTREGGTDALVDALLQAGVRPDQMEATDGKYGGPAEKSITVHNPDEELIKTLGREFGQESVLFSKGGQNRMEFVTGADAGKSRRGDGLVQHKKDEGDYRSRIRTGSGDLLWTSNLDFDNPPT